MPIKAALFDKDGTLFSFQKTWGPWVGRVIKDLADGDRALENTLATAWAFDPPNQTIGWDSIVISGTVAQVAQAIFPYTQFENPGALVAYLDRTGAQAPVVEQRPLVAFLDQLAALGLAVGIATNDSESTARAQLHTLGLEHRFGFIAGYDSGHGGKPDPGMCLAFADHLDMAADEIVMVGDSSHDMQAGRGAGMRTIGVLSGVAQEADLAPHADVILPDIGLLPDLLATGW